MAAAAQLLPLVRWPDLDSHLNFDQRPRSRDRSLAATWCSLRLHARAWACIASARMLSATAPIAVLPARGARQPSGKTGLGPLRSGRGPIVAVVDPAMPAAAWKAQSRASGGRCPWGRSALFPRLWAPGGGGGAWPPSGGTLPAGVRNDLLGRPRRPACRLASGLTPACGDDPELAAQASRIGGSWDLRKGTAGSGGGPAARPLAWSGQPVSSRCGTDMAVWQNGAACLERGRQRRRQGCAARFRRHRAKQVFADQRSRRLPLDCGPGRLRAGAVGAGAVLQAAAGAGPNATWFVEARVRSAIPAPAPACPCIRGCQPTASCWCTGRGQTMSRTITSIPLPPVSELIATIEQLATLADRTQPSPASAGARRGTENKRLPQRSGKAQEPGRRHSRRKPD